MRRIASALVALALLACQPAEQATPTQALPAPLAAPKAAPPRTALLAVRLTPRGEVTLGAAQPRDTRWVDPLLPFEPAKHAPAASLDPAAPLPDAQQWELALVTRDPALATPLVAPLLLLAPDHNPGGDLLNEWHTGGALWRAPWISPATSWELVRVSPAPPLRLTRSPEKP